MLNEKKSNGAHVIALLCVAALLVLVMLLENTMTAHQRCCSPC